ncbi:MAG: 2,3-bisphosphoglycerate-dependent phosphoglycerate mutase [bacterium]
METEQMGKLVLVRHGESEWNKLGKWTGLTDVHLSETGKKQAEKMGKLVENIQFSNIFISKLIRTQETLDFMKKSDEKLSEVPTEKIEELNERDYGDYTGKNKWEIEKSIGEEEFQKLRRGWDYPVPGGENLKMVYDRTIPFFINRILPILIEGKNVLVVAHGNSIRSIIKYIENVSDHEISNVEMPFDGILIYDLNKEGHILTKEFKQ